MSNFSQAAYHPVKNVVMGATWMDDYFGRHKYGVWFSCDNTATVFKPDEVEIPIDVVFVPTTISMWESEDVS